MTDIIAGANYPLTANPTASIRVAVQGVMQLGDSLGLVWIGLNQRREPVLTPAYLQTPTDWATADGGHHEAHWQLKLAQVAQDVQSLLLVLYQYSSKGTLAQVACQVSSEGSSLVYRPALADCRDSAMIIAEVYRRQGEWKFRALAEGSPYGLAALGRNLHLALDERSPKDQVHNPADSGDNDRSDQANMWTGTAFAITPHHVLTCAHVIEDAGRIELRSMLGLKTARLVAQDVGADIALLAIEEGQLTSMLPIRHGQVGLLGEALTTMGYPLSGLVGNNLQVTQGCVSSLRGTQEDIRFFQFTAPIQPGSSGSPVLDHEGQVLGMVTSSMLQAQNMNFAVKHHLLMAFLEAVGIDLPESVQAKQNQTSHSSTQLVRQSQSALWHVTCYR